MLITEFQRNIHTMPQSLQERFWGDMAEFHDRLPKAITAFHADGIEARDIKGGVFPRRLWTDVSASLKIFYDLGITFTWKFSDPIILKDDKAYIAGECYSSYGLYSQQVGNGAQIFTFSTKDDLNTGKAIRLLWKGILMWLTGAGDADEKALDEEPTPDESKAGKSRIVPSADESLREYWESLRQKIAQEFNVSEGTVRTTARAIGGETPTTKAEFDFLASKIRAKLNSNKGSNEQPSE